MIMLDRAGIAPQLPWNAARDPRDRQKTPKLWVIRDSSGYLVGLTRRSGRRWPS